MDFLSTILLETKPMLFWGPFSFSKWQLLWSSNCHFLLRTDDSSVYLNHQNSLVSLWYITSSPCFLLASSAPWCTRTSPFRGHAGRGMTNDFVWLLFAAFGKWSTRLYPSGERRTFFICLHWEGRRRLLFRYSLLPIHGSLAETQSFLTSEEKRRPPHWGGTENWKEKGM